MSHINLLPWREEKRFNSKKEFLVLISVVAVICFIIVGFAHGVIFYALTAQNKINTYLQQQLTAIDAEISKGQALDKNRQKLLSYLDKIKIINKQRRETTLILNHLTISIPSGIYLTDFSRKGEDVEVKGVSESNTQISQFMTNIQQLKIVKQAVLSKIESGSNDKSSDRNNNFDIQLVLKAYDTDDQADNNQKDNQEKH